MNAVGGTTSLLAQSWPSTRGFQSRERDDPASLRIPKELDRQLAVRHGAGPYTTAWNTSWESGRAGNISGRSSRATFRGPRARSVSPRHRFHRDDGGRSTTLGWRLRTAAINSQTEPPGCISATQPRRLSRERERSSTFVTTIPKRSRPRLTVAARRTRPSKSTERPPAQRQLPRTARVASAGRRHSSRATPTKTSGCSALEVNAFRTV